MAVEDRAAMQLPLDRLAPGERGVILRLDGDLAVTRRLMELGLVPGTEITLVRRAPLGDPIELSVRGAHLSLRRSEASQIHVSRS
jgi:Fe2+ transport system protein FeoA